MECSEEYQRELLNKYQNEFLDKSEIISRGTTEGICREIPEEAPARISEVPDIFRNE